MADVNATGGIFGISSAAEFWDASEQLANPFGLSLKDWLIVWALKSVAIYIWDTVGVCTP